MVATEITWRPPSVETKREYCSPIVGADRYPDPCSRELTVSAHAGEGHPDGRRPDVVRYHPRTQAWCRRAQFRLASRIANLQVILTGQDDLSRARIALDVVAANA